MKLYYITSGYRRPIDILDNALLKALSSTSHEVEYFMLNRESIGSLLPRIQAFQPDIMITLCGPKSHIPIHLISHIRRLGILTVVWFADDPYAIDNALSVASAYDAVFTIDSGCIPFYTSRNCHKVYHLPLGTDTNIFRPYPVHPSYHSDVCFIGTGYDNRLRFFKEMLSYVDQDVHVRLIGHFWDHVDWSGGCVPHIRTKWVNFTETPRYLNGANIVLNIHRSEDDTYIDKNRTGAPAHSINNRTYDIAACRAFQLVDYRVDLPASYELQTEMISFESPKEAADQIHHYLQDIQIRQHIADQAYERTLNCHTFSHRLHRMMTELETVMTSSS